MSLARTIPAPHHDGFTTALFRPGSHSLPGRTRRDQARAADSVRFKSVCWVIACYDLDILPHALVGHAQIAPGERVLDREGASS